MKSRPHWYSLLPAAMIVLPIPAMVGLMYVADALDPSWMADLIGDWLMFIVFWIVPLGILWLSWVRPFFAAPEMDPRTDVAPRLRYQSLRGFIWMPCVLFVIAGCMMYVPFLIAGLRKNDWYWNDRRLIVGIYCLAIALVAGLFGWALSFPVYDKLRRTSRKRNVCFECGYDLRANPDAPCPECGFRYDVKFPPPRRGG